MTISINTPAPTKKRDQIIFEKKSQLPNESLSFTYHKQKSTKFEHQEKNDDEDRHEMDGICVGDGKEEAKNTTTTTTYSFEF